MREAGVMRFALFGAVGFGIGGTIAGPCWSLVFFTSWASALLFILSGAVGGASLGLALKDQELGRAWDRGIWRRGHHGVVGRLRHLRADPRSDRFRGLWCPGRDGALGRSGSRRVAGSGL